MNVVQCRSWRGRDSVAGEPETRLSTEMKVISLSLWQASARAHSAIYLFLVFQQSWTVPFHHLIFPAVFPDPEVPSSFCWYLASEEHIRTKVFLRCPRKRRKIKSEVWWLVSVMVRLWHNYPSAEYQWKHVPNTGETEATRCSNYNVFWPNVQIVVDKDHGQNEMS